MPALSKLILSDAALKIKVPSVTAWNRLEGRPRDEDFSRSLRAEVRDPLWMLCRQWQTGEFQGEDAGTALEARFVAETARFQLFTGGNPVPVPYSDALPLEVNVEREALHFDIFTQIQIGKTWVQLLRKQALTVHVVPIYVLNCPFESPIALIDQDYRASTPDVGQWLSIAEGRIPNGEKLLTALRDGTHATWISGLADAQKLADLGQQLLALFARVYSEPDPAAGDCWKPQRMEYQFAVTTGEGSAGQPLVAEQYYDGHLDWYSFDRGERQAVDEALPVERQTQSYIPTPIQYYGMPNRRWWAFEEGVTNLGNLNAQTSDLATLLFAEFALLFTNDWHLIPCPLPVGSLTDIQGILVTDVFGLKTWVRPVGRGLDDDWNRWSVFNLKTLAPNDAADTRLLIPPTLVKTLEGEALEEVRFIRDEMANLVWGIEQTVGAELGQGQDGYEAANRLETHLKSIGALPADVPLPPPPDDQPAAMLHYQLGTTVPRNWIPFIPVNITPGSAQIRLQKAAMPEFVDRYGDTIVASRTTLLRATGKFFLNEEEVPRSGAIVKRMFNRTRWYNGKVFTWVAKRKEAGRGEGESGLSFDQVR